MKNGNFRIICRCCRLKVLSTVLFTVAAMIESDRSEASSTGENIGSSPLVEEKKSGIKRSERDSEETKNCEAEGRTAESTVVERRPTNRIPPRRPFGAFSANTGDEPQSRRRPAVDFPLLYVAPTGTISVLLHRDVIVEIAVDKAVRVVCCDKFAVSRMFEPLYCYYVKMLQIVFFITALLLQQAYRRRVTVAVRVRVFCITMRASSNRTPKCTARSVSAVRVAN